MNAKQHLVQSYYVTTEGDELYYEVRGQGKPLLLIAAVYRKREYEKLI